MSVGEQERREDSFIEELNNAMIKANYTMMMQDLYDDASKSKYLVHLDMILHKEKFATDYLDRFHARHLELEDAADINRYCLVYHRNVGVDKSRGLFLFEKIDLAIELLFNKAKALMFSLTGIILFSHGDAEVKRVNRPSLLSSPLIKRAGESKTVSIER